MLDTTVYENYKEIITKIENHYSKYNSQHLDIGGDGETDVVKLISYSYKIPTGDTEFAIVYINLSRKLVSKFDLQYNHVDFSIEELKLFDVCGFELHSKYSSKTIKHITDWFDM